MNSNGPAAGAASSTVRENSSTPAAEAASSTAVDSARTAAGLASLAARRRHFLGPPGRSTYAQVAAGAPGEYGAEDVDPPDHLDALYEGEVAGSQWPRRRIGGGAGDEPARERRSRFAAGGGLDAEGSSSVVEEAEASGGGSGRHREEQSSPASQSLPVDQASREGNIPVGPSGGITIHSIQPHLSPELRQHPNSTLRALQSLAQIPQPIVDPDPVEDPLHGGEEGGWHYRRYDDPPAPWRSLYTHGNEPLDVDAGGIEGVYEDVMDNGFSAAAEEAAGGAEDGGWRRRGRGFGIREDDGEEDDIGLLMSARNAHDNAEERLRRGGNNMRRRNMIQELISRHSARPPLPLPERRDVEVGTTRRVPRARGGVRPPTISSSVGVPVIRSTNPIVGEGEAAIVGEGGTGNRSKGRSRSVSADGPSAKRRKLSTSPTSKDPGPQVAQEPLRPSYLSHFTLSPHIPLPTAFESPARDSHLALTTYTPLTPLPPLGRHITQPQISFTSRPPNTSSSTTVRPWRPSGQPTTGRAGLTTTFAAAAPSSLRDRESFRDRDTQREREYGDSDATSLRTLLPIPPGLGVHYYEIKVLDSGPEGYMSLGWVTKGVNMQRLVGWEKGTWGFHADDGRAFEGRGTGRVYSSGWGVGDVIGAGVDFTTRRAFFTRNGVMIGPTFTNLPLKGLHPAIGLRNPRESLAVNLLGPFMFDIDSYVLAARDRILSSLKSRPIEIVPSLPALPPTAANGDSGRRGPVITETILSPPPGPIRVDSTGAILLQTRKPRSEPIPIPTSSAEPSTESGAKAEEEGVIAPESELADPSRRAQLGFVLDFLAHRGLDRVKGMVVKDLERRKAILRPTAQVGEPGERGEIGAGAGEEVGRGEKGESAAKRIEGICEGIKAGGRVPFDLIPLAPSDEEERGKGMGGLGRKLRVLDLVAMATPPSSSPGPADPAGPSSVKDGKRPADAEGKEMEVDDEAEAEVEMNESAMKAGKELLAMSKVEKWTEGEKGWLTEAFGVVCGLPLVAGEPADGGKGDEEGVMAGSGVWAVRRKEWSEELRGHLREHNNLKPKSHLEHALIYSQALISTLADGMDGSAGFVDPKTFLEGYGRKEVHPKRR